MSNKETELKTWLKTQGCDKFEDKLRECGVETLDDLRVLTTEDEIMELAGTDGINMGVVYRRKFVKAVLDLKGLKPTQDYNDTKTEPNDEQQTTSDINASNDVLTQKNTKGMSKKEEKALTELVQTIKSHTTKLKKKTKEELTKVQKQNEDCRNEMISTFDKAMGTLLSRRKTLEQMIQMAHDECTKKLSTQIEELQSSAKKNFYFVKKMFKVNFVILNNQMIVKIWLLLKLIKL